MYSFHSQLIENQSFIKQIPPQSRRHSGFRTTQYSN